MLEKIQQPTIWDKLLLKMDYVPNISSMTLNQPVSIHIYMGIISHPHDTPYTWLTFLIILHINTQPRSFRSILKVVVLFWLQMYIVAWWLTYKQPMSTRLNTWSRFGILLNQHNFFTRPVIYSQSLSCFNSTFDF